MPNRVLEASLRAALEPVLKKRDATQKEFSRCQMEREKTAHALERAKDAESWAAKQADEKADNLSALVTLMNSKPIDERTVFQSSIEHLQSERVAAVDHLERMQQACREQENEYRKAESSLKQKQDSFESIANQLRMLQSELEQALR